MTHSEVRALLGDYLEGDLEIGERARLASHLPECPRCSAELRALRATIALLRGLPDPEPPADLGEVVMRRVAAGEASSPVVLRAVRSLAEPRFATALAAGLAGLAIFAGLQAVSPERSTPAVRPLARIPMQPPPSISTLLPPGAAFRGSAPAPAPVAVVGAEQEIQLFLQNPNRVLDRFAELAESRRQQEMREFAERVSARREADAVRARLAASRHQLAGQMLVHLTPSAPQRAVEPLPVTMTSGGAPPR